MIEASALLREYERWMDAALPADPAARADKHRRMAASPFAFLRASYPLWIDRLSGFELPSSPFVACGIGDLHIENFGTWRAAGGEAFGPNDYDETGPLPALHDVLRLAISALLAADSGHLALDRRDLIAALWHGYCRVGDAELGTLLDGHNHEHSAEVKGVADAWHQSLPDAQAFWAHLDGLSPAPSEPLPDEEAALLPAGLEIDGLRHRVAGLGSRDHVRTVVLGRLEGARAAFELKPLAPRAAQFAADQPATVDASGYRDLLDRAALASARTAPDLRLSDHWLCRQLEPERGRIGLAALPRGRDERALLALMGETCARCHALSTNPASLAGFADHGNAHELHDLAHEVAKQVIADHREFAETMAQEPAD